MLRRITLLLSAALLFVATSCVREAEDIAAGGDCVVTIQAQLPADFVTRAIGDGTTATTLTYAVYDKARTDAQEPVIFSEDEVTFTDNKASITFGLATGHSYDIVFWADAAVAEGAANPYTFNKADKTITVSYTGAAANDESRDAFFGQIADLEVNGAVNETVTLTRPFAQLNLGTDDAAAAKTLGVEIAKSAVKVANVCNTLNLLDGSVSGDPAEVNFEAAAVPAEQLTVGAKEYGYLGMNYILVSDSDAGEALTECTITLNDGAKDLPEIVLNNVPLKRNHRTNILGSLITSPANIEITVDGELVGNLQYNKLRLAAAIGGEVKLTEDLTIDETIVVRNGVQMVVNLNGKTITCKDGGADEGTSGAGAIWVREGELIINGTSGEIDGGSGSEHCTVAAFGPNSKITINGGKFTVGGGNTETGYGNYNNCVYAYDGAQIVINGGTFENEAPQTGSTDLYAVLNVHNTKPGTITVNDGTFVNYDPATGDDNRGGSFVAEGYASVKTSDNPKTYQVKKIATASNVASTLNKRNSVVPVMEQMTLAKYITSSKANAFLYLGKDAGISVPDTDPQAIIVTDGSLTIGGEGTITGPKYDNGSSNSAAVWSQGKYAAITIEDGVSIKSAGGNPAGTVNAAVYIYGGTVTINGGYFYAANDKAGQPNPCVFLKGDKYNPSSVSIYGGVFESETPSNNYLINVQDGLSANFNTVKVYGGTFVGFDPSQGDAGVTGLTTFVAEGYKSVETDYNGKQAWEVVPE